MASSAGDLASALVKLELFGARISALVQERVHTDRADLCFRGVVDFRWPFKMPESLVEAQATHAFDSHPQLDARLHCLKADLSTVFATPLENGAIQLIENADALEARLIAGIRAKFEKLSVARRFTFVPRLPSEESTE